MKLKFKGTFIRLSHVVMWLPNRLWRIVEHGRYGLSLKKKKKHYPLPLSGISLWWLELFFLLADVLAIPEIYETTVAWGKWNTRGLTTKEIETARSVFGNSIDYRRVRVDESAKVACRGTGVLYVSFFTINSWGKFGEALLIHELMHVWQFQKFGSVYIPRALLAQRTKEGYNYGGMSALKSCLRAGGSLLDFNFEQQGDIIADGFCLRHGLRPRWVETEKANAQLFEKFLAELDEEK